MYTEIHFISSFPVRNHGSLRS